MESDLEVALGASKLPSLLPACSCLGQPCKQPWVAAGPRCAGGPLCCLLCWQRAPLILGRQVWFVLVTPSPWAHRCQKMQLNVLSLGESWGHLCVLEADVP